jgi:transcriptional regulator with XRE-family HTH domain
MGFRENLKQELNFSGIVVKELAASSGVPKRALDSYLLTENASIPSADNAVRIAKALGVSVEYLVTGEGTTTPNDVRKTLQRLMRLNQKDRKIVDILINALVNRYSE